MVGARSDKRAQRAFRAIRLAFLVVFLVVSTTLGLLHQFAPGTKPASVDALDPFGGIESAFSLVFTGTMLAKIAWSSFVLLFATLAVALVFRRAFCGMVCSFGALQELFGKLGKLLFRRRLEVPAVIDRPARYLKYVMLAGIVVWTAVAGTLVIRPYDPWAAYHHLLSAELISGFLVGLVLLIVSLVGSLLYDRFFCKYLCPMGGFLGLINRIGWFRVRRNDATCTHCFACDKACPVNLKVEAVAQVQSAECINCNLCVNACPVKDTLSVEGPRGKRISSFAALGISLAIFVAALGVTTAAGVFRWTIAPLAEQVAKTNVLNPDDIKGTDTFAQVAALSGIPQQAFLDAFGISAEDFEKPIKDAAHREGSTFDTEAVREFVRNKLGQ
jgi:polyferredoxin